MSEKERTPRDFDEEFEELVGDPEQSPILFLGDEHVQDLGPAIAEGSGLREVLERYQEFKRGVEDYE